jgi:hypothetical protein
MKSAFLSLVALPLFALLSSFAGVGPAAQAGAKPQAPVEAAATPADADVVAAQKPSYPLKTCPVCGEALGKAPVDVVADGRLIRVCCNDCKDGALKDRAAIVAKIDAAVIAGQKKDYPLATCPISGEPLGATAVDHVHGTRLVRFCCGDCVKEFQKDPAATNKKLDAAYVEKQKASYPLDTCLVSGEKLGSMGEPIDYLYGTRLYRLCCAVCKKEISKHPYAMVAMVEAARAAKE